MTLSNVDLPLPLGPISATFSPRSTRTDTASSTVRLRPRRIRPRSRSKNVRLRS